MAVIKHHKYVSTLPATLEADSIYYVRRGTGFDIYVTNSSGLVVAYPLNSPIPVREQLTADRTYYVRTDGSDSNNGLANNSGGAFRTIQKAVDTAAGIDSGVYQTTIKIGDGTYSENIIVGSLVGAKPLIISGNEASPASVVISVAGNLLTATEPGSRVVVSGVRFHFGAVHLNAAPGGRIEFYNIIFGACSSRHINAQLNGFVGAIGNYTIEGGSQSHITCNQGGKARLGLANLNLTITITGSPAFTDSFVASRNGPSLLVLAGSVTFIGAATGVRYRVAENGVIFTNGAGVTFFPGNADGTTATGGQYV